MTMCAVCKNNPVTLKGCKTCSLTCSTLSCGDNPIDVNVRLRDEVSKAKSIGVSPMVMVSKFLLSFYDALTKDSSLEVNITLVSFLREEARAGRFFLIDQLLKSIAVERLSNSGAIALVRASYLSRHKLANWKGCVDRVRVLLDSRGADSARLLRGLV